MEEASTIVIKVKYGDTLRRFRALISGEKLQFTMDGLRLKIVSLFNFASDSDLVLTYIDEDGEVVTLIDDADLLEAVKQALNPLRITVKLNSEKNLTQVNLSSQISTPSFSSFADYFSKMNMNRLPETERKDSEMSEFDGSDTSKVVLPGGRSQEGTIEGGKIITESLKYSIANNLSTEKQVDKTNLAQGSFSESILVNNRSSPKLQMSPSPIFKFPIVNSPAAPQSPDSGKSFDTYHYDVVCDGCGAHPIIGPRFKSKTLSNYDLCMKCFVEKGSDADYIRMDQPAIIQQSTLSQGVNNLDSCVLNVESVSQKLDSCFIQDVNIVDGTTMAPSTTFTKTWRMKNNGTLVWPHKSKLVWIGGDKLSSELAVELKIPLSGSAIDQELDVSVNFISPALPGRYISYWRMESPSGKKFGQVIRVYIQVCSSERGPTYDLNFHTLSNSLTGPATTNVNTIQVVSSDILAPPPERVPAFNLNFSPSRNSLTSPETINVDPQPKAYPFVSFMPPPAWGHPPLSNSIIAPEVTFRSFPHSMADVHGVGPSTSATEMKNTCFEQSSFKQGNL